MNPRLCGRPSARDSHCACRGTHPVGRPRARGRAAGWVLVGGGWGEWLGYGGAALPGVAALAEALAAEAAFRGLETLELK